MTHTSRGQAPQVHHLPALEASASHVPTCAWRSNRLIWHVGHRCIPVVLIAFLFHCPLPAQAAAPAGEWWDVSYGYRKQNTITVGASAVPASTVTALTFDHAALVTAGRSQADGDDIRLLYWTGATWTELPRIVASGSSWNNASTRILFKTQAQIAASGSDNNYYIYYGNSSVTAPSTAVPSARYFETDQLAQQNTTVTGSYQDIPGSTLTFTPGHTSETWLIFASGVMRTSSTSETAANMQLLVNGVTVDLWGHQNLNATTPNGAGFIVFDRITGTTAQQTIQPQFYASAGTTTYVTSLRVLAVLVPPGADVQFAETDATTQQTGSNINLQSLTFTPSSGGDYMILGKMSQHETPSGSTVRGWLEEDDGVTFHPNAPAGTRFANARAAWQPLFVCFKKTLAASSRTFYLRGMSGNGGVEASEWRYRRIMAFRTDAWESVEYNASLTQSTTTSTTFQTKNSLATAVPPAARDYVVIQSERISGDSADAAVRKSGELRDGGTALVRTDHRISRDGSGDQGYHHIIGVAQGKNTAASVTYTNGYASPDGITAQVAESTITALRYHEPSTALAAQETAPTVAFTSGSQSHAEDGTAMTITAQLSETLTHDVSIPFTLSGTATNGTDYSITASPVTITAGNLSTTITISVVDDQIQESNETVIVTMGTPTNALQGATTVHTATITNDDTAGVTVTESGGSTDAVEGGATDSYTVVLTSKPTADVTITPSADAQSSVNPASVTFTSANWNVAQTITVTAVNDSVDEDGHTSTITHAAASGDTYYNGVGVASVTANITDNDTAGVTVTETGGATNIVESGATDTYTVVLTSQPTANVTVTITPDGQSTTNPTSLTFTSGNWSSAQTVTVTAVNDALIEGAHTSTITHTAASGDGKYNAMVIADVTANITDNDTAGVTVTESGGATNVVESGATDTYTLVLIAQPAADVIVTATPNGQLNLGAGEGSAIQLTFTAANWNTPQTITVAANNDAVAEGNHTGTIAHTTTSADGNFNSLAVNGVTASIIDNDNAAVTIAETGGTSVTEGSATDTYTIALTSEPTADVTVSIATDGETSANPASLTFNSGNWNVPQTVTVTADDDLVAEGNHVSSIAHTADSADTNYDAIAIAGVTANITDNDEATASFTLAAQSIVEDGGAMTVSVQLSILSTHDVTVPFTVGGTAVDPADYTITASPVTILAGNLTATVTITVNDDAVRESNETVVLTMGNPTNATKGAVNIHTATIGDNEPPGFTVAESGGATTVTEGGATDTYTVVLLSIPTDDVVVTIATDGRTSANPASLTFTPVNWSVPQAVTVTAANDFVAEGLHLSTLTHTSASADAGYDALAIADVNANITDNDTAGVTVAEAGGSTDIVEGGATDTYSVVLTSEPTADVTVTIATDAKSTVNPASLTFTSANWSTPQDVTVTAVNDDVAEGNHTSAVTHTSASGDTNYDGIAVAGVTANITDNETAGATVAEAGGATNTVEGGATDTYTVVLTSQPLADVTVTVDPDTQANLGGGAGNIVTLTFTSANWSSPQTVTVTAVNDSIAEGAHSSTIAHTALSADPAYDGVVIAGVTANITDNDNAGVTITEGGGATNTVEGGATDTYTVLLTSEPTANVTVTISPDAKSTTNPVSLTFTSGNWSTAQTVTVAAVNDDIAQGAHTSTISHTGASGDNNYNGIAIASVTANITDNDSAGVTITEGGGATSVIEGGATDTYTVVLTSEPTANVVVTVTPNSQLNLGAGAGVAVQLTFTSANWDSTQTVTVTAVNDAVAEGNHTGSITHTITSADTTYDGIATAGVTAGITDNDTAGVTIAETAASTDIVEGGATDTYTVVLTSEPTANVTVTITTDGKSSVNPASLTFTSGNWSSTQTVTVTAVNDDVVEGAHTSAISHTAASVDTNYNAIVIAGITADITDNDTAGVTVTESGGATNIVEGGATDTYTIVLASEPTADVVVTVTPNSQLNVGAGAGTAIQLTFTSANWDSAQTVTVTAVNDDVDEDNHTGSIVHTVASGDPNYNTIATAGVTANITDNDNAGVTVTESGGFTDVTEGGATDTYNVVLTSEPTADVTVTISTDGKAATNPATLTFTNANWDTLQTVTVTADDDAVAEAAHTSTITHAATSADTEYNAIAVAAVTANITDNDEAIANFTLAAQSGNEDAGNMTVTVQISTISSHDVTIPFTVGGTATNPTDYTITASPVTITAGNLTTTITVTVNADAGHEDDETVVITMGNPTNATKGSTSVHTATIRNDDAPGILINESAGTTSVTEGGATDTYTVVMLSQPTADTTITIATDGRASVNPASLTFTGGNWSVAQTITVTAADDAVAEGLHTSTITHTAATADVDYNGIAIADVTANITDNDTAGITVTETGGATNLIEGGATDTYTVVLTSEPTANVIVTIAPDAHSTTNPTSLTFTSANWSAPQTVTVTAVNDDIAQGDHTSEIVQTAASGDPNYSGIVVADITADITDNDVADITIAETGGTTDVTEGGVTDTYTVVLTSEPTANVTITIDPDIKADVGGGAGNVATLTFTAANWDTPQTVTVTAADDDFAEGAHISTIIHTAISADSDYNGPAIADVTANITDNDTAGVTITQSGGDTSVVEGGAADTYTVVLTSEPTANVTVTVDPDNDINLGSGAGSTITLTFTPANWDTPQTVTATGVNDDIAEGNRTATITHTAASADPDYAAIAIGDVTVDITDDDIANVVIAQTAGATVVTEAGGTDTYTVVLTTEPTANVTVTVDPAGELNTGAGAGTSIALTFTAANWGTPQTVTVAAIDNEIDEGNHTAVITHSAASADSNYDAFAVGDVTATITDNDTAGVTVTQSGGSTAVTEGGATDSYTIVLNSEPTADAIVTISPGTELDLGGGDGTAIQLTFTAANWDTPQTITVTAVDDSAHESFMTTAITYTVASADPVYNGMVIANLNVSVTDNDPFSGGGGGGGGGGSGGGGDDGGGGPITPPDGGTDPPPDGGNPGDEDPPPTIQIVAEPVNGGTIEVVQVTDSCDHGEAFNLTALPCKGYVFDRWDGDMAGSENPAAVCASGAIRIIARFARSFDPPHEEQIIITQTTHYGLCAPVGIVSLAITTLGMLLMKKTVGSGRYGLQNPIHRSRDQL